MHVVCRPRYTVSVVTRIHRGIFLCPFFIMVLYMHVIIVTTLIPCSILHLCRVSLTLSFEVRLHHNYMHGMNVRMACATMAVVHES